VTTQPVLLAVAVLAGVGVLALWRAGRKTTHTVTRRVREATRLSGIALETVTAAIGITALQWAGLRTGNPVVTTAVLAVPALFAGHGVARLFFARNLITTTTRRGKR
jgi:hypothetical protein